MKTIYEVSNKNGDYKVIHLTTVEDMIDSALEINELTQNEAAMGWNVGMMKDRLDKRNNFRIEKNGMAIGLAYTSKKFPMDPFILSYYFDEVSDIVWEAIKEFESVAG